MAGHAAGGVLARLVVVLALVGGLGFLGLSAFRAGSPPHITIEPELPGIGRRTPIKVTASAGGRGLDGLKVVLVQGERSETLAEEDFMPRSPWSFWGPTTRTHALEVEVGRETLKGLKQGPATIRVTAQRAAAWLRSPDPVVAELTLPVRLTPPSIQPMSTAVYVAQGGCEAIVYRVGTSSLRDGIQAGAWWFPGFPLPGGGAQDRFALFAVPYDTGDASKVKLVAEDDVGNRAETAFIERFFPRPLGADTIQVSDSFMNKVVSEILSQSPEMSDRGGLLENYLGINRDLRKINNSVLVEMAKKSETRFLWNRPFQQMPNSQVMAKFADRRTYVYHGRDVDQQDHLGFDLAVSRATAVPAANDGKVVLARYFGIYGNAVVIDHGYGLMSLYGHLSSIDVAEGQAVARGQKLGLTGETGLAGGDHLHFTMLLQGLPVHPAEWFDGHWIQDRIARKLEPVLRLQS